MASHFEAFLLRQAVAFGAQFLEAVSQHQLSRLYAKLLAVSAGTMTGCVAVQVKEANDALTTPARD